MTRVLKLQRLTAKTPSGQYGRPLSSGSSCSQCCNKGSAQL